MLKLIYKVCLEGRKIILCGRVWLMRDRGVRVILSLAYPTFIKIIV